MVSFGGGEMKIFLQIIGIGIVLGGISALWYFLFGKGREILRGLGGREPPEPFSDIYDEKHRRDSDDGGGDNHRLPFNRR